MNFQDPHPALRMALVVLGVLLMLCAPVVAPLPGPAGTFVFLGGLVLLLRYTTWAKRLFARFKRRWPRVGGWADWGLRRQSAARRRQRDAALPPN